MTATYRDVKADILSKIVRGEWGPGGLIPGEIELAEQYSCARATVNRAVRELADDGIVERRRKAGTRVRMTPIRQARFDIPLTRNEIEESGSTYRYALMKDSIVAAPDWLRTKLTMEPESQARRLICLHYADDKPYQLEDRWINLATLPQAGQADFSTTGPNEWLVATVPFSDVEIAFSARAADTVLARHLDCTVGDALFTTDRSTWWEGKAVTHVSLSFRPGHRMTARY